MTRNARRIVEHFFTNHRAHAIGCDQGIGFENATILIDRGHACVVLGHACNFGGSFDLNQIGALRTLQNGGVNVSAVNHGIGVFEAIAKSLAHRKTTHFRAVNRIHHDELFCEHCALSSVFTNTQGVKCGKGIGGQLNARANFAKLGGLF